MTIDRPAEAGGEGLGFSGGQLLLMALGACYTNDIFREALSFGVEVSSVEVTVEADWGGTPVRAQNVVYRARVEAAAGADRVSELLVHTDRVAEIQTSLRMGTTVRFEPLD